MKFINRINFVSFFKVQTSESSHHVSEVLTTENDLSCTYLPQDFDPNQREIKGMSEEVRLKKHSSVKRPQQLEKVF